MDPLAKLSQDDLVMFLLMPGPAHLFVVVSTSGIWLYRLAQLHAVMGYTWSATKQKMYEATVVWHAPKPCDRTLCV